MSRLYGAGLVSVSARPASDLPSPANASLVDLRAVPGIRAGTFLWDGPDITTGWHRHPYHQIEYALQGVAEVETPAGHYLLPPQQAIWIPARLPHATTLRRVRSVSVFVDPAIMPAPDERARVLAAAPVIREMIGYATRWPIARTESDATADRFFEALAHVVLDWLDHEAPLCLPTTTEAVLTDVMAFTNEHLRTVTAASVCHAVGISERTLRRRFPDVVGMTWRAYVQQSRLLRAMTLLAERDISVLAAATSVGFDSPSAFTRAFQRWTGESPSAYRRRVRNDAGTEAAPTPDTADPGTRGDRLTGLPTPVARGWRGQRWTTADRR
jgi:AraC-like DNA-binding protein